MDYLTVEPDYYALLTRCFTPGRGGHKITAVTRHHMAGALTGPQLKNLWENSRAASAHYGVEPSGRIVQLVNDRDTAWAVGNQWGNQTTISIEHANSGGAARGWPISDTVIVAGARLAAALCLFYGLGRPVYGKNIKDHKDFSATGCPMHLANGGKYHKRWMDEAQRFYDELAAQKAGKKPAQKPAPTPAPKPENTETTVDKKQADRIEWKLDLIMDQLAGPERAGAGWKYSGWPQLGGRTLVDAVETLLKREK